MREMLQTMYKINRDRTVVEALVFGVWCLVFVLVVLAVNDVQVAYSSNNALFEKFVDRPWPGYTPCQYFTLLRFVRHTKSFPLPILHGCCASYATPSILLCR